MAFEDDIGVFTFIRNFRDKKGYSPTLREIGQGVGVDIAVVRDCLKRLEKNGYIRLGPPGSKRAIGVLRR